MTTIARVAAVAAAGGSVRERAQTAVDELHALIPMDCALLSGLDPTDGRRTPVVNNGYSERLVSCLNGDDYHTEIVEPFGLPNGGWPFRECDLPVDPLTLRCVADHFRPAGLVGGLMCALVTADGRYVGFLDISGGDPHGPSEEACAVVGHLTPALANLVDPLQSLQRVASTLDERCLAFGLVSGGRVVTLQRPADLDVDVPGEQVATAVSQLLEGGRTTAGFLWPSADGWLACRAFHCHDGTTVVTMRELEHPPELTNRELEVLTRLVQGRSNAKVAAELGVTVRTVKAHVEHILEKLEVPTRTAAVSRAIHDGLLLAAASVAPQD